MTAQTDWNITGPPDWLVAPENGWHSDDLDRLPPEAPRHVELIRGQLVLNVNPQRRSHWRTIGMLETQLRDAAPDSLAVDREMTVLVNDKNRPEPDLLVLDAPPESLDDDTTSYPVDLVKLAVEVVSPATEDHDRSTKALLYAEAGIPSYWIVDHTDDGAVRVEVFALEDGKYVSRGTSTGTLTVTEPFPATIDLTALPR
jgi:Uma2 family endonuclease